MPLDKGVTVLLIAELVDDSDLRWYDRCIMDFPECFCDRINDDLRGWSARTGSPFEEIRLETCSASLGEVIAGKKPVAAATMSASLSATSASAPKMS